MLYQLNYEGTKCKLLLLHHTFHPGWCSSNWTMKQQSGKLLPLQHTFHPGRYSSNWTRRDGVASSFLSPTPCTMVDALETELWSKRVASFFLFTASYNLMDALGTELWSNRVASFFLSITPDTLVDALTTELWSNRVTSSFLFILAERGVSWILICISSDVKNQQNLGIAVCALLTMTRNYLQCLAGI